MAVYGADGEHAHERMAAVLAAFAAEEFASTSGAVARFTFSAGMASYPTDGSTLNSLERMSETALRRAGSARNSIVTGGERPDSSATATVDVALVEDDDSVADVIEHALNLRRYSFVRFDDGAEAATALGEGRVRANVVLLDIGLPSLDGFGVLQVLRDQGDAGRHPGDHADGAVQRGGDAPGHGPRGHTSTSPSRSACPSCSAGSSRFDPRTWHERRSTLIIIMLVAIGSAVAAVLITVWVSSLVQAHRVRVEPTLSELRRAIVAALSGERAAVGRCPGRSQPDVSERYMVERDARPGALGLRHVPIGPRLPGEQSVSSRFARVGVGSRRWSNRLYCARVLTTFGVESDGQSALLVDRSPEVRAQAAAWCVATPGLLGIDQVWWPARRRGRPVPVRRPGRPHPHRAARPPRR